MKFTLIRGNAGELAAIAGEDWQAKGVDAGQGKTNLQEVAQRVAQRYNCTVLISGEVDIISDGQQTATVHNGTPLFPKVTASGCLLSAVCAAFLAVDEGKHFSATIEACAAYTIAGEIAAKNLTMQVGQFQIRLLDELATLTPDVIEQNAEVNMSNIAQVLTIAGSDSGGGAGIQADLKTFQMQGVFGTSVITAVTAQNTLGVFDIHPIPLETIQAQLEAVKNDFQITSAKIGMLGTADIIECVADFLSHRPFGTLVLDPVMIAKGGAPLLQQQAVSALIKHLLPLADVITPNIPEVEALTGIKISNTASIQQAALDLQKQGAKNVIIKGGHSLNSQSQQCQDWILLQNGEHFVLESERFDTPHTHGTGCTFSACLTAELAKSVPLKSAVKTAKDFITAAISHPLNIGHGHGPTNHWAYNRL